MRHQKNNWNKDAYPASMLPTWITAHDHRLSKTGVYEIKYIHISGKFSQDKPDNFVLSKGFLLLLLELGPHLCPQLVPGAATSGDPNPAPDHT